MFRIAQTKNTNHHFGSSFLFRFLLTVGLAALFLQISSSNESVWAQNSEVQEGGQETASGVKGKLVPKELKNKPKKGKSKTGRSTSAKERRQNKLIKDFEKYLTGATLEGNFTVLGADSGKQHPEKYSIVEAKKGKKKDQWIIKARIQYGKKNLVVPVPVKVLWAGNTPVITLERTTIIGMGTFSARVLFNEGMYSGTWKHDDKGGHLFGKVIPAEKKPVETQKETPSKKAGG